MEKPKKGFVVDGSTRGNPGPSEYRAMNLATGEVVFHCKIGIATNNITEFIALAHCVLYCIQNDLTTEIYTDSQTALSWLRKKSTNSSLPNNEKTAIARDYMNRIIAKLKDVNIIYDGIDTKVNDNIIVSKWYSSEYGEIPADFGYKNNDKYI